MPRAARSGVWASADLSAPSVRGGRWRSSTRRAHRIISSEKRSSRAMTAPLAPASLVAATPCSSLDRLAHLIHECHTDDRGGCRRGGGGGAPGGGPPPPPRGPPAAAAR